MRPDVLLVNGLKLFINIQLDYCNIYTFLNGMDFITRLPKTKKHNDSIMVVVDKLSKETHFIPVKSTYKVVYIADIFMK